MANTPQEIYHQLITEEPIVVALAMAAAVGATLSEYKDRDDHSLDEFMARIDEHLEFLQELYPEQ